MADEPKTTPTNTCMACKRPTPKDKMLTKRAVFFEPGRGGRQVRSRTLGDLCPKCIQKDPEYSRKPYVTLMPDAES